MHGGFKHKLTIDWMISDAFQRNSKLWRSCWKSRAWTAHGIIQSHGLRKLRKRAKNCENMCVSQLKPLKKTLRKPCKKLAKSLDLRNISPISSIFKLLKILKRRWFSPYFREEVLLRNLYRDSRTAMPNGGFFKGDLRDSAASWRRNASTWKMCPEECNNFYSIESVDIGADELKTRCLLCSLK